MLRLPERRGATVVERGVGASQWIGRSGERLPLNTVLIDYESVQPVSLSALERGHFKVIVFVGAT
jgi:hypothetical protein